MGRSLSPEIDISAAMLEDSDTFKEHCYVRLTERCAVQSVRQSLRTKGRERNNTTHIDAAMRPMKALPYVESRSMIDRKGVELHQGASSYRQPLRILKGRQQAVEFLDGASDGAEL